MDFITPEDALERWGGEPKRGTTNRVWAVEGNTVSFFWFSRISFSGIDVRDFFLAVVE